MNGNQRPKLKIRLAPMDKWTEGLGWLGVIALWALVTSAYATLPDTIPVHYNGAGQADAYGTKANLLTLPLVATVLFAGLTLLNRFPHVFNYPTEVTPENAQKLYTSATRLIRYLKLIIVLIFGAIAFRTIRHAQGSTDGLGIWFLPLTLGLIFIPLGYFVVRMIKSE
jgi:uncharacterized membrane protein